MRVRTLLPSAFLVACDGGGGDSAASSLAFPDGFRWGVSTSAFQTEGGTDNDYDAWIAEGGSPEIGDAADSWNRWEEDLDLAEDLGMDLYRMGIEWSRVEPEDGTWDEAAIAHYREVLEGVRARGMTPLVTLHHFTNPRWVADGGGWGDPAVVDAFGEYAGRMGAALGDLVDDWNPQNEPMVYAAGGALTATLPPAATADVDLFLAMVGNLLDGHGAAARALRDADLLDADGDDVAASIWTVGAVSPVEPSDPGDPEHVEAALAYDHAWNHAFPAALVTGEADRDLDGVSDGYDDHLAGTADVIGLNYYTRVFVSPFAWSPLGGLPCMAPMVCPGAGDLAGDNGSEVWPVGLHDVAVAFSGYGLPLAITENGLADDDDDLRPSFLVTHLSQLQRATEEGVDVRAYLHWSLVDNYEWTYGFDMRFGLVAVDFATGGRQARADSTETYRRVVAEGGIAGDLMDRWDLPDLDPRE